MKVEGLLLLVAYLSAEPTTCGCQATERLSDLMTEYTSGVKYDWGKGIDIPDGVSPVRPVYRVCGCCGTSSRRGNGSFNVGLIVSTRSLTLSQDGHTMIDIDIERDRERWTQSGCLGR